MAQTTLGLLEPFHYGRGYRRSVVGTSPAAGTTFSHTIPADACERLLGLTFTLTTSSAAANRSVTLDYSRQNVGTFLSDGAAVIQTASLAQVWNGSFRRGTSEWNTGTPIFFPLWGLILEPGEKWTINVANMDASDTLTAIIFTFEKFEVGRGGYAIGGVSTDEYCASEILVAR